MDPHEAFKVRNRFGLAPIKAEGSTVPVDAKYRGGNKPPASDWMELNIPRKMSRKRVHAMVDQWLDKRV